MKTKERLGDIICAICALAILGLISVVVLVMKVMNKGVMRWAK